MLIFMLLLALHSNFQLFQFRFQPFYLYKFISSLILNTPCIFSRLSTVFKHKSYAFRQKPDSNVYLSNQISQGIPLIALLPVAIPDPSFPMTNAFSSRYKKTMSSYQGACILANPHISTSTQEARSCFVKQMHCKQL